MRLHGQISTSPIFFNRVLQQQPGKLLSALIVTGEVLSGVSKIIP